MGSVGRRERAANKKHETCKGELCLIESQKKINHVANHCLTAELVVVEVEELQSRQPAQLLGNSTCRNTTARNEHESDTKTEGTKANILCGFGSCTTPEERGPPQKSVNAFQHGCVESQQ